MATLLRFCPRFPIAPVMASAIIFSPVTIATAENWIAGGATLLARRRKNGMPPVIRWTATPLNGPEL